MYDPIATSFPLETLGGMVPVGKRLLIQTPAFLYCIGLRQGSGPQVGEK